MPDATTPPILPPTTWKRYKRLLQKYYKAVRDITLYNHSLRSEAQPPNGMWLDHEVRIAKDNLDDFVATLIGNRHQ